MALAAGAAAIVVFAIMLSQARFLRPVDEMPQVRLVAPDGPRYRYPDDKRPSLPLPGGMSRQVASVLNVEKTMKFGDFEWNDEGVPAGTPWVRIDLAKQMISVFRGDDEVGTAVILYGTDGMPTPTGRFTVRMKDADYHSRSYDAPMPFAMFLTDDGVAIHASDVRQGFATHGCIGVPKEFARRLFTEMGKGDTVWIMPPEPGLAPAKS